MNLLSFDDTTHFSGIIVPPSSTDSVWPLTSGAAFLNSSLTRRFAAHDWHLFILLLDSLSLFGLATWCLGRLHWLVSTGEGSSDLPHHIAAGVNDKSDHLHFVFCWKAYCNVSSLVLLIHTLARQDYATLEFRWGREREEAWLCFVRDM